MTCGHFTGYKIEINEDKNFVTIFSDEEFFFGAFLLRKAKHNGQGHRSIYHVKRKSDKFIFLLVDVYEISKD